MDCGKARSRYTEMDVSVINNVSILRRYLGKLFAITVVLLAALYLPFTLGKNCDLWKMQGWLRIITAFWIRDQVLNSSILTCSSSTLQGLHWGLLCMATHLPNSDPRQPRVTLMMTGFMTSWPRAPVRILQSCIGVAIKVNSSYLLSDFRSFWSCTQLQDIEGSNTFLDETNDPPGPFIPPTTRLLFHSLCFNYLISRVHQLYFLLHR